MKTIISLRERALAVATNLGVMPASLGIAAIHIGLFVAVCGISYLHLSFGHWLAAAILTLAALASPLSGLLLVLTAVAFQYLFWFAPGDFLRIDGALALAYMVRTLPITLPEARRISLVWALLALFIVVVFVHLRPEVGVGKIVQALGFLPLAAAIFLHARRIAGTPEAAAVVATPCLVGLVAAAVSFVYLYLPAPELFLSHSPLFDLRLRDLRLTGAQDDSIGMARLLLPAVLCLMVMAFLRVRPIALWLLLFALGVVLLTATATKSVMLSLTVAALLLIGCFAAKCRAFVGTSAATAVAAATIIFVFSAAGMPILRKHAAESWKGYSEPTLDTVWFAEAARQPLLESFLTTFRIGLTSWPQNSALAGDSAVIAPPDSWSKEPWLERLLQTGSRLGLMRSGLQVVSGHPWWGIGHKTWPIIMQELTGFPYLWPGNAFLETWGSYGVLGALLYLGLIAFVAANSWRIEARASDPTTRWLNRALTLYLLVIILHEFVEVSTILAVTPIALWAWAALGLQDGLRKV